MPLGLEDLDMPQPITRIVPDPYVLLDSDALAKQPEMARLVCRIFATWASIEHDLGSMLVRLLGADSKPALAMFSILQTQKLQTAGIEAAAKGALSGDDYQIFSAVMTVVNGVQKNRNKLAHWAWARCKERPDLLLLGDPDKLKERANKTAAYFQGQKGKTKIEAKDIADTWDVIQFDLNSFLAYSKGDLERDLRDLEEATQIMLLHSIYMDPSFSLLHAEAFGLPRDEAVIRDELFQKLNELRLFREALDQIRASQKSTPQ